MKIKTSGPEIKEIGEYFDDETGIVVHMDEQSAIYSFVGRILVENNRKNHWAIDWEEEFLLEDRF